MNVRMKTALLIVAVVVPSVLVWFSTLAAAQPLGQKSLPTVRYVNFKAYDPTFIGIAKGFFRKAGVNVVATGNFPTGPSGVAAAGAGQVDAGLCAVTGLSLAVHSGIKVHGVADIQTEFPKAALEKFYVQTNSSVHSIKDLRGKRIGVNGLAGSFYYTWLIALAKHGMSASDVTFVNMPFSQQEQALASGQIDAAGFIDPWNRFAEATGQARLLFRAVDILGSKHISLLWMTDKMIADKHVAHAFIRGYLRSIQYVYSHPVSASRIEAKAMGIAPRYNIKHRYTNGAGVRLKDVAWWLHILRQQGALNDGGATKPKMVVTQALTGDPNTNPPWRRHPKR